MVTESPHRHREYAPLLTASEAAHLLNVCDRTIRRLGWNNQLSVVRVGRAVRYRADEIHAILTNSEAPPTPGEAPRNFSDDGAERGTSGF